MVKVNPTGFTRLGAVGDESTYKANIIFVHGLGGKPRGTWSGPAAGSDVKSVDGTAKPAVSVRSTFKKFLRSGKPASKIFWPEEFLTEDIKDARIWTYGYDVKLVSGFFEEQSHNNVSQHGKELAAKIEEEITNKDPIIFVAHSLGGILVKDAIHRSRKCKNRTRLIVFLGTPHRGSSLAKWGSKAAIAASLTMHSSNKAVIKALEVRGEVLDNIHTNFTVIAEEHKIKVHSFQEGQKLRSIDEKVVDDLSSKLGLPELETVEVIDADHQDMVKCSSRDDMRYQAVYTVLSDAVGGGLRADFYDPGPVPVRSTMAVEMAKGALARFCVPFLQNSRFTGREAVVESIRHQLFITNDFPVMGILGLGGVGKSQIALQLAYWVKENQPDYSVFWIPAFSRESFENTCTELVREIGITKEDEEDDKEAFCRYLSSGVLGKWFIILDNADDFDTVFDQSEGPQGIESYLPPNENGRILFTTRNRRVAVGMAQTNFTVLKEMSQDEGLAFFRQALPTKAMPDEGKTIELLELLCYLPLAISQAAAYIVENQSTINEYLKLFKDAEVDMLGLLDTDFKDKTRDSRSQNAVLKTWFVSFDQIERLDEVAYEILLFMPFIEPKAVPFHGLPTIGPGYMINEQQLKTAIDLLCGYEMLYRREDGETYDMHSLVHVACSMWIKRQEGLWEDSHKEAANHLWSLMYPCDWEHRDTWRPLIPHALALYPDTGTPSRAVVYLMSQVAHCLRADGKLKQAIELLQKAKGDVAGNIEGDEAEVLFLHQSLATLYTDAGRTEDAVKLLERSLIILSSTAKDVSNLMPTTQLLLASAYVDNGQLQKGIELYESIVASEKPATSDDDDRLIAAQRGLATAYFLIGRREDAFSIWRSLLNGEEDNLTRDDPTYLSIQTELALAYRGDLDTDRTEKALPLMEQIVDTYRSKSIESQDALQAQKSLASAYINLGQESKAIELLVYTTKISETNPGEDHPLHISAMTLLAQALSNVGYTERATKIFEWAFVSHSRNSEWADRIHDRHENMILLAREYVRIGKAKQSIVLLLGVAREQDEVPADEKHNVLDRDHGLALAYQVDGQVQESIALFEKVLETQKSEDDRSFTEHDLAISYFQSGQRQRAIDLLEKVLQYQVGKVSMKNPVTMLTARYLVEFYEIHKGLKPEKTIMSRVCHPPPRQRVAELDDSEQPVHEKIERELACLRNLYVCSASDVDDGQDEHKNGQLCSMETSTEDHEVKVLKEQVA